jgi:BNR repeat-like domain
VASVAPAVVGVVAAAKFGNDSVMSRLPALAFAFAIVLLLLACGADAAPRGGAVTVSRCPGSNAEVVQAVDGRYVYEAWIGCSGIGFARSVDGGKTFGPSIVVPQSHRRLGLHAWDPAIAVGRGGTVYVASMLGPSERTWRSSAPMRPVVAVSHDHGRSFGSVSKLPVPSTGRANWGDREFIAVGRDGAVHVTWNYGPRKDRVNVVCPPTSSCYFGGGDFNGVLQKSVNGGETWTRLAPITPAFPHGGVVSAPIVAEPAGALDVLYLRYPTNPKSLATSPGREYFIRSEDGGKTWSKPVAVGARAGTVSPRVWWINGSIAVGGDGVMYASWDTQLNGRDTAWLAWSKNHGKSWSPPLRVASSRTEHLTQVAAAGRGSVYVAWQTVVPGKGYATFLRRYSIGHGWTAPATQISMAYGRPKIWPGDTFGLSARNGSALVSWGSAVKPRKLSEIYFSR